MPRRRPNAVRATQRRNDHTVVIPGLPPSTTHALNRLDRDELRPDVVRAALRQWQAAGRDVRARRQFWRPFATGPMLSDVQGHDDQFDCPACAADRARMYEPFVRDVLSRAIHALPRAESRQLRRLVQQADSAVLRQTLPHPARTGGEPWWHSRIVPLSVS